MVCEDCLKKTSGKGLIVPDKWKDGARPTAVAVGGAVKAMKTNKALEKRKAANQWIPEERNCKLCKFKVQMHMNFCNDCAYKKGICAGCGKKVVDTSSYKMSTV